MKDYKYTINGNKYEVAIGDIVDNIADVTVNGEVVVKPVAQPVAPVNTNNPRANMNNALKAPLPGIITEIKVNVGDDVKVGDTVVVLEAMKMANNLEAEKGGKVTSILVQEGESVMEDTPLVVIE